MGRESSYERADVLTPEQAEQQRLEVLSEFHRNRRLAHEVIFKKRHPLKTPGFHHDIQDLFHSALPQVVVEGFRDAAKSTVAEESFVLGALYEEFKFGIVVGASVPRAKERLGAIKNEFVVNDAINQLFGKMEGETWGEQKIVLTNGVCIQAVGAGQSMRGMRHLDARPDFALIDDLEDEESVRTPEQREKVLNWLYRTFLPALSKGEAGQVGYRVRFMGNRLDRDAVIVRVSKDPAWKHIKIPVMVQKTPEEGGVERFDLPPGTWAPTWAEKFSLQDIASKRAEYERLGILHAFDCEYMCEADDPASRIFKEGDAPTVAHIKTWQATYAAYDPARTVNSSSAMTGKAVFSWIGSKLLVWSGDARLWLPDEIVDDIFTTDERWGPVEIGVEATGLEEFILQPIRARSLARHVLLPLRRLIPPKGKDHFIRSLQPFFKSGSVEFVDVSAEARGQLLSFPTGRKDFPNALAYALLMKPGLPVYDGFSRANIEPQLIRFSNQPWYLAVNATIQYTTGILLQVIDGQARVHADWVREGPPGEVLGDLVSQARLDAGAVVRIVVPPDSGRLGDVVGLRVAARAVQIDPRSGGDSNRGRDAVRRLLGQLRRDQPMLTVCDAARWVLNGFSGGYCFGVDKRGALTSEPVEGPYRVLMEGLESFVAVLSIAGQAEDRPRLATGDDGRVYKTIRAIPQAEQPTKDEWYRG